jgi:hypothetical protein
VFGHVHFGLTASLLMGSIPGVYLGARFSSGAPDHVIRPMLVTVLVASAVKLLGANNQVLAMAVGTVLAGWGLQTLSARASGVGAGLENEEPAAEPTLPG